MQIYQSKATLLLAIVNTKLKPLLTARWPNALRFLAVRGVFPRSFPGVLKMSATLLGVVSIESSHGIAIGLQVVGGEYLAHMLIKPFHLIFN